MKQWHVCGKGLERERVRKKRGKGKRQRKTIRLKNGRKKQSNSAGVAPNSEWQRAITTTKNYSVQLKKKHKEPTQKRANNTANTTYTICMYVCVCVSVLTRSLYTKSIDLKGAQQRKMKFDSIALEVACRH